MTRFIGDIHGNLNAYRIARAGASSTVQVGDFGMGFFTPEQYEEVFALAPEHKFIRGNHDDLQMCQRHPNWIKDGIIDGDVMFVGGAQSPDHRNRLPGMAFWPDEEVSESRFREIEQHYLGARPSVMVTHDAPFDCAVDFFGGVGKHGRFEPNRTSYYLQAMFEAHQPDLWIFGHYHRSHDEVREGTRFRCLAINEGFDIDVGLESP